MYDHMGNSETLLSRRDSTNSLNVLIKHKLYKVIHSVINDSYMQNNTFKKLQDNRIFHMNVYTVVYLYVKWMFKTMHVL